MQKTPIITPAPTLNDGLILYLPCQEGSGRFTADLSGADNHGILNGVSWLSSVKGHALGFDGNNDIVTVSNSSIIGTGLGNKFSILLWFNPSSITLYDCFITFGVFGSTNRFLTVGLKSTTELYVDTYNTAYYPVVPAMSLFQWYHLVLTADGTNFRIYFMGVLANTTARNPDMTQGSSILGYGKYATRYFHGRLKYIRVYYDRVLSAVDIRKIIDLEG